MNRWVGFVHFASIDDADDARREAPNDPAFEQIGEIQFSTKGTKRPRDERAGGGPPPHYISPQPPSRYSGPPPPSHYGGPPPPSHYSGPPPSHYSGPPPPSHYGGPRPPPGGPYPPDNGPAPPLPPNASNTLYVERIPDDATEREVTHIFRRFDGPGGFKSIRMTQRESKKVAGKMFWLCWADFSDPYRAFEAMKSLQGYRMDEGFELKIAFAKSQPRQPRPPARDSVDGPGETQAGYGRTERERGSPVGRRGQSPAGRRRSPSSEGHYRGPRSRSRSRSPPPRRPSPDHRSPASETSPRRFHGRHRDLDAPVESDDD